MFYPSQMNICTFEIKCGPWNSSVQFSRSVVSDSLRPHGPQHARPPCPSPTPRVYPNSCPLSQWCHPTISSSVIPFSSCLQYFPASGSFPRSQFFTSDGKTWNKKQINLVLMVQASAIRQEKENKGWFMNPNLVATSAIFSTFFLRHIQATLF